jgi:hypothetical protein
MKPHLGTAYSELIKNYGLNDLLYSIALMRIFCNYIMGQSLIYQYLEDKAALKSLLISAGYQHSFSPF